MFRVNDFTKEFYKVSDLSKLLNLSVQSIQSYVRLGKLNSIKKDNKAQLITRESILEYLKSIGELYIPVRENNLLLIDTVEHLSDILELRNIDDLITIFVDEDLKEKIPEIVNLITSKKVSTVYVFSNSLLDKLTYDLIKNLCNKTDTEIIILRKEGF